MDFTTYRDKVLGCWNGKNIGGTLGAPFECSRGVFDADFYTQELNGKALPNDDLDMQILWLAAAEAYGRQVNSRIFGEYWLAYVIPNWSEYGVAKNNLKVGIAPPLSGLVGNTHKDSNGSWIFSELWACLAPGNPEIAVKYAKEEASVAHAGEGIYSAVFCAAVQSAAFGESDPYKLIDIGLSYIPSDCDVARAIGSVLAAYRSGKTWQEARRMLIRDYGGTFGLIKTAAADLPEEERTKRLGYDAPSGIGMVIIGWLYGEGDFGQSICIAANCGDDSDCTAGTLGALLGIIRGNSGLEEKWLKPLGGYIETLCIDTTTYEFAIPKTTEEMTDRVVRLAPVFLGPDKCDVTSDGKGYTIRMANSFMCSGLRRTPFGEYEKLAKEYNSYSHCEHNFLFDIEVVYGSQPYVQEGQPFEFTVRLSNNQMNHAQWLELRWHLPEGWLISSAVQTTISLGSAQFDGKRELKFVVTPINLMQARYDLILQVRSNGHYTQELIPISLFTGTEWPVADDKLMKEG